MLADTAEAPPIAIYERAASSSRRVNFAASSWKSSAPRRIMTYVATSASVRQAAYVEATAMDHQAEQAGEHLVLAQACGVSMLVGLACAAASYVPGFSFTAYGAGLALLAAAFFGSAAADS